MTKEQALNNFWNRFNIPAYDENTVPDEVETPYITYEARFSSIENDVILYGSIWDSTMSWENISLKAEEINQYIGLGGASEPYTGGRIWIKRGNPFSQRMEEPGSEVTRRILLSLIVEYQSEN